MFDVIHRFDCNRCKYSVTVKLRGNIGLEEPTLPHGARTLHNEMDVNSKCFGWLRYAGFTVSDVDRERLKNLTYLKAKLASPTELTEPQSRNVATALWQDLQAKQEVPQTSSEPADFWRKVKDLYHEELMERDAAKPKNALEAMNIILKSNPGKDGTLAVAFNTAAREYVTGRSGKQSANWKRECPSGKVVQNTNVPDRALISLEEILSGIKKKGDREVWVCAEVDAAVKALKKGWDLDSVHFYCREYKSERWREIQECGNCIQWAYK